MSGSSDPSLDKDQLKSSLRLSDCHHANTLTTLLSLLFEPTDALHTLLVPSVLLRLTARGSPPDSYDQLIEICKDVAEGGWTLEQKAEFISGHPMIGEVKLSGLSGAEQGQGRQDVTSRIVLERLAHLNSLYCTVYPGLRYITFVNNRPRSAIIPELESLLGLPNSPQPPPDDFPSGQPSLDSDQVRGMIKLPDTQEWQEECERGLDEVWRIGRARLSSLGLG